MQSSSPADICSARRQCRLLGVPARHAPISPRNPSSLVVDWANHSSSRRLGFPSSLFLQCRHSTGSMQKSRQHGLALPHVPHGRDHSCCLLRAFLLVPPPGEPTIPYRSRPLSRSHRCLERGRQIQRYDTTLDSRRPWTSRTGFCRESRHCTGQQENRHKTNICPISSWRLQACSCPLLYQKAGLQHLLDPPRMELHGVSAPLVFQLFTRVSCPPWGPEWFEQHQHHLPQQLHHRCVQHSRFIGLPYIGRRGTLSLSLILTSIFLFAFTTARIQAQILAFNCISSFVQYIMWGALYCYTPEVIPSIHRGTGTGMAAACNRICSLMAPIIATYVGYTNMPIFVSASLYIVAGLLSFAFPYETSGKASL